MSVLRFFFILLVFNLASCANLRKTDKSFINHQAMSFKSNMTPAIDQRVNLLCGSDSNGVGGCKTCAK